MKLFVLSAFLILCLVSVFSNADPVLDNDAEIESIDERDVAVEQNSLAEENVVDSDDFTERSYIEAGEVETNVDESDVDEPIDGGVENDDVSKRIADESNEEGQTSTDDDENVEEKAIRRPGPNSNCGCTYWTRWYDRDNPSGTGDWETLDGQRYYVNYGSNVCDGMRPIAAQCWYKGGAVKTKYTPNIHTSPNKLLPGFSCEPEKGIVCRQGDQNPKNTCKDWKIRYRCVRCRCLQSWENTWRDRDNPSGTGDYENRNLTPYVCNYNTPMDAKCLRLHGYNYHLFNQDGTQFLPDKLALKCTPRDGLACVNSQQSPSHQCSDYKIKYHCMNPSFTYWTPWYNRDWPTATGDWETVHSFMKERNLCDKMTPLRAYCRVKVGNTWRYFNQWNYASIVPDKLLPGYTCNPEKGLACRKTDQKDKTCHNYEIRFVCPCK